MIIIEGSQNGEHGDTDQGQYLKYMPMTIRIKFIDDSHQKQLTIDGNNRIFTAANNEYTLDPDEPNRNKFEEKLEEAVDELKILCGDSEARMQNLAKGVGNLFNAMDDRAKLAAIKLWNANVKTSAQVGDYNDLANNNNYKNSVYKYYEYVQFKRARFDCKDVKYDDTIGRIIELYFESTGKIN